MKHMGEYVDNLFRPHMRVEWRLQCRWLVNKKTLCLQHGQQRSVWRDNHDLGEPSLEFDSFGDLLILTSRLMSDDLSTKWSCCCPFQTQPFVCTYWPGRISGHNLGHLKSNQTSLFHHYFNLRLHWIESEYTERYSSARNDILDMGRVLWWLFVFKKVKLQLHTALQHSKQHIKGCSFNRYWTRTRLLVYIGTVCVQCTGIVHTRFQCILITTPQANNPWYLGWHWNQHKPLCINRLEHLDWHPVDITTSTPRHNNESKL